MASGNDDDDKGKDAETRGRKVPQGFEKILKRTRRGINHDKEKKDGEEEQSAGKTAAEGDDKEASGEDRKEEENDDGDSEEKKKENKDKDGDTNKEQGWGEKIYGFFMEPNGGGPNYENWFKLLVVGGFAGYYALYAQPPSQEITYMDFVH